MSIRVVYDFPSFDTGEFASASFSMGHGDALLTIVIDGIDDIVLRFSRARWHEFTANYNCSVEQVQSAFFTLIELEESDAARRYMSSDRASRKAYTALRHFRVFLEGHGCHELFAENVVVERTPQLPRAGA